MKPLTGLCITAVCLACALGCSTTGDVLRQVESYDALPVEARLGKALELAVDHPRTGFPGAAVYVSSPKGTWQAAAGLADMEAGIPLSPAARLRAGSIMKSFVAVVTLQLVEEQKFALDSTLPEVLPESVYRRFEYGEEITVRQLLNHTSGIPEWDTPRVDREIGENPTRIRSTDEYLDLAASHKTWFPPGEGWRYSNTDYNLLGLVIERATGKDWREEIETRVLEPLSLRDTLLPRPGTTTIPEPYARGYNRVPGKPGLVDLTEMDPSMAGAAGGAALVTTLADLATFYRALYAGELYRNPNTRDQALDFVTVTGGFPGWDGYGLGIMHMEFDGEIEMIGHLGGTAGYMCLSGYLPAYEAMFSVFINAGSDDPSPAFLPALRIAVDALQP